MEGKGAAAIRARGKGHRHGAKTSCAAHAAGYGSRPRITPWPDWRG